MNTRHATESDIQTVQAYGASLKKSKVLLLSRTSDVTGLSRRVVAHAFRELERRGLGVFVIGRRGNVSRFVGSASLVGATSSVPAIHPPPPMPRVSLPPAVGPAVAEYHISIRNGGASVHCTIPLDLESDEALHIADVFMSLSDQLARPRMTG